MIGFEQYFETLELISECVYQYLNGFEYYPELAIGCAVTLITSCVLFFTFRRRRKGPNGRTSSFLSRLRDPKPRFRKRDKVRFYTTKMLRKMRAIKDDVFLPDQTEGSVKKRRSLRKSSVPLPKFLQRHTEVKRTMKEPPPALLEADLTEAMASETQLPSEVMYMLRSVRVFGQFETPLFFELCKYIITKTVPAGKALFKPGPMEDCIYIVQSGQLNLYLLDKKGNEMILKKVKAGENIYSVMNILDAIRGCSSYRYSITIRAAADSQVLMLPSRAFKRVFEDHPQSLVRVVQIVMLRLQQVTFQAFHRFLGLSTHLISASSSRKINEELKSLSVYSLQNKDSEPNISTASPARVPCAISPIKEDLEKDDLSDEDSKGYEGKYSAKVEADQLSSSYGISKPLLIRQNSVPPKQSVYGNSMEDRSMSLLDGPGSIDMEAVLERAGFDVNESVKYSGTPEDGITLNGTSHQEPSTATTEDGDLEMSKEEEDKMMAAVRSDLVKLLNLPTPKLLDDILSLELIPNNSYMIKQGDKDSGLCFVVTGSFQVYQTSGDGDQKEKVFVVVPGEFVGSMALLTGDPSLFSVIAKEKSYVVKINKVNFYKLMMAHPKVVLPVAQSLNHKIAAFVRNIDFALDWMQLEAGKPLYRQGEDSDSIYIVLNGRLRGVEQRPSSAKKEIVGEYGRGEFVGLVEVLTHRVRAKSVHAVRDTELAQIPHGLLNTIKLQYPQVVSRLIQLLGDRILGSALGNFKKSSRDVPAEGKLEMVGKNLSTIAVIPASNNVPVHNFTFELGLAIADIDSVLVLTSDVVKQRLGTSVLDSLHEYNLSSWLGHQEDTHRIVVYQADMYMSEWTRRCIRQADAILIVALGDEEPTVGKLEEELENMTLVRAQKDLILLYEEENFVRPTETVAWLNARSWVSAHHHIRCPRKIFKRRRLADRYSDDPNYEGPSRLSDFARLARVLTGTSVGLVLGGGGARGISHVGIIRALTEAGVPIDSVGGTSMGALIGAIYAENGDIVRTTQRSREACKKLSTLWRKLMDLTYPYTSFFTGKSFNSEIGSIFENVLIEDLLLPYFCITTDISSSKMKIHQTGCLWRYVRASMSLAGYLPPMCDPLDGNLLLDGGYVNNLPADVMRSLGVKTIVAVDVGSQYEDSLTNFGDHVSGWWLLWKRFNPFAKPVRIPDMNGIQSRLAYVSCVRQLEEVKSGEYAHYVRPPIDHFKTMQFGSFEEINDIGYQHGKKVFAKLFEVNDFKDGQSPERIKHKQITAAPTFTDLAELVSRLKVPGTISQESLGKVSRLFDNYFDDDDLSENEDEDFQGRAALSDQEMMPESDIMSGVEELGYESDASNVKRRRVFLRTLSNKT